MKLIQATVAKPAREVTTKYGDRVVLDCITATGEEVTIWRGAGDSEVLGRYPNERVTLALDGKGKYSLIETASTGLTPSTPQQSSTHHNGNSTRAPEIKEYVGKLAKLYAYCYKTVSNEMSEAGLRGEALKDISTTLFVQIVRKFEI